MATVSLPPKYPPEDRDEYDRAYAPAALAGQLAKLVYTLRTRVGLTQTELARRMGTTQSSIARIESGGSLLTLNVLARLAHATSTPLRRPRHYRRRPRRSRQTRAAGTFIMTLAHS